MSNKKQKEFYNKTAKDYDSASIFHRVNRNHLKKIRVIRQLLQLTPGEKFLEIGTGTGIHANWLVENNFKGYHGVDISQEMLKEAIDRKPELKDRLVSADGHDLPFKSNSFNKLFFATTLHHLSCPEAGLREAGRVTEAGGKIVLMEPNYWFPKNFFQAHWYPHERNNRLIQKKYIKSWLQDKSLKLKQFQNFLYTPPWPKRLWSVYDKLDRLGQNVPILNKFSIMIIAVIEVEAN